MKTTGAQKLNDYMTPGRVYRLRELTGVSSNLSRDIKKLVEAGEVVCASAGIYYKPEMTRFGPRPAAPEELIRAFLNDDKFLLTSRNAYNSLGLGLTQLYNESTVLNRKRHGEFILDGTRYTFRIERNVPEDLSKEFLLVDLLNNFDQLAEDTTLLQESLPRELQKLDRATLLQASKDYGRVATRKYVEAQL